MSTESSVESPIAELQREGYTYADPAGMAQLAMTQDGLTFLRSAIDNTRARPPIGSTLDFRLTAVDHGTATFAFTPKPWQYNPIGSVHGGVISTLLDSAAGCAVHSTLPVGRAYTSLDLNVRFLRPASVDSGELRAIGVVLSAGRRTALVEAKLLDATDRLIAHATSTCLLLDLPSA